MALADPAPSPDRYEQDCHAWTREQAARLRAGQFHLLDLEPLAEEIVGSGRQSLTIEPADQPIGPGQRPVAALVAHGQAFGVHEHDPPEN